MMIEIEVAPAPVETVTPIKPSEAIRLGCLLAPVQAFGSLYADEGDPDPFNHKSGKACAIGAMILGGYPDEALRSHRIHVLPCPEGCRPSELDSGTPAHLNDEHRWSRERIADWLEGMGL